MPRSQVCAQHWLVAVQGRRAAMHMVCRQVPSPQTPEQQWLLLAQRWVTALQVVSHVPPMQRWLQQSTSVVHAEPGSTQTAATQVPLKLHCSPAQHHDVLVQKVPAPWHASCRHVPREQLREQQSASAAQVAASATQGARQTPSLHVSPLQQPVPHACPSAEQATSAWQVPPTQVSPAQHSARVVHPLEIARHAGTSGVTTTSIAVAASARATPPSTTCLATRATARR